MLQDVNDVVGDNMPLISVRHKGNFRKTESYLANLKRKSFLKKLDKYGQMGVEALQAASPVRTGKTAASWRYVIEKSEPGNRVNLMWINDNTASNGDNIVKLLVRGHGTRNGHYVKGRDFVTPAIAPIFDEIAKHVTKEVAK